jgi:hypothetical protein
MKQRLSQQTLTGKNHKQLIINKLQIMIFLPMKRKK